MMLAQFAFRVRNHPVMCAQNDNVETEPCQYCGSTFDVDYKPDPYDSDIHGDYDCVYICSDCAHERSMAI